MEDESEGTIGLVEFLRDLRGELDKAHAQAAGETLQLGVEEITVTLDVAYKLGTAGEVSAGAKAKFWVLQAEAGLKGNLSSERLRTQRLTLTLKPRTQNLAVDEDHLLRQIRGFGVAGQLAEREQDPVLPAVQAHLPREE